MKTDQGELLAAWARARLREELGGGAASPPAGAWSETPGATFVTLRWTDGRLQGCVGSLEARRTLAADVASNAIGAALLDPRAEPLALRDVDDLDVEVSVLTPIEPIPCESEAEGLARMRPGVDGIVLSWRGRRATFLPIMWGTFPDARDLLRALKRKAGLDPSFWASDMALYRYTVDKFVDAAPSRAKGAPDPILS